MLAVPSISFSVEERQDILASTIRLRAELDSLRRSLGQNEDNPDLLAQEDDLVDDLLALRSQYADGTPVVDLSRCPFTGLRFSYPIDTFGLDGPWWDYGDPVRPDFSPLPSVYAITGAVALRGELESMPFVAAPGPGRPYVIPRLLETQGSAAVISSLAIGAHQGYAILYYSFPAEPGRPVVDEWASDRWYFDVSVDGPGWEARPLVAEELDFELGPWITNEKLYWIAPGDEELIPYKGTDECPYLDLQGGTDLQWLFEGSLQ